MKTLKGRTALVTGASRGLGLYIVRALAREGMNLVLAARSADKLEAIAGELRAGGTEVLCVPTDVGDPESLAGLAARAETETGGVDLLGLVLGGQGDPGPLVVAARPLIQPIETVGGLATPTLSVKRTE